MKQCILINYPFCKMTKFLTVPSVNLSHECFHALDLNKNVSKIGFSV